MRWLILYLTLSILFYILNIYLETRKNNRSINNLYVLSSIDYLITWLVKKNKWSTCASTLLCIIYYHLHIDS